MTHLPPLDPLWVEELQHRWRQDPQQVTPDWQAFFLGFELASEAARPVASTSREAVVQSLIQRYRELGHLLACTDPLSPCPTDHPRLTLANFGLTEAELPQRFHPDGFVSAEATLAEILQTLRATYCRHIGVEFMHIPEPAERQWLIERMEPQGNRTAFATAEREQILLRLQQAGCFEAFLHRRFPGQKRFSLEGGETLIPVLDQIARHAAQLGIAELVLGMPHRGRLNVLAHIFDKPYPNIFAEFADNQALGIVGEGDVKYHKGFSCDRRLADGRRLHLSLTANPSHLEIVSPVVEGRVRARQDGRGDAAGKRSLPLLIHGDAAFAGQGVVAETLNLSQLEGYRTGGTLHIVLNNQIGFTTSPKDGRSTHYATDMAKLLAVPVFHVHGERPEDAVHAARLALEYRQAFGKDVVLEIFCYRRHGHNETDEPAFTQPLMVERIRQRPPAHEVYAAQLQAEGVAGETIEASLAQVQQRLEKALTEPPVAGGDEALAGMWQGLRREYDDTPVATAVPAEQLSSLAERLTALPPDFNPHSKVLRLLEARREAVRQGAALDWGTGEALAFASLVEQGFAVRLAGQDSRRGTFSHRHAAIIDQTTGESWLPLQHLRTDQAPFQAWDSLLSEMAVLGFEYGYSLEQPQGLVLWEAQFGDFANGAQVVIDQFIVSGETKWERLSGLTLLLPHGFEGQGAEHSSARVERFLQLCAQNNLTVAVPSSPAQLFHLLRRQLLRNFRRPLVVLTPKSLLRHPRCVSPLADFAAGGFREAIGDVQVPPEGVRTVLLCCGKIYYELLAQREREGREDVALVRIEQLYPLNYRTLGAALAPFPEQARYRWVQEEPANAGAWAHLRQPLARMLGRAPQLVSRPASPTPAGSSHRLHALAQQQLIDAALAD